MTSRPLSTELNRVNVSALLFLRSSCRFFSSEGGEKPKLRPRRQYLDIQRLRENLKDTKRAIELRERRARLKNTVPPPPQGWTTETFIRQATKLKDGQRLDALLEAFPSWSKLMLWDSNPLSLVGTPAASRVLLRRKVLLYLHGLWPSSSSSDDHPYQAPELSREGSSWTTEDDKQLQRLIQEYGVHVGDPWLYISWLLQRTPEDVHKRYIQKHLIPSLRTRQCAVTITHAAKPLRVNRHFRLDPPFVYFIPSAAHYTFVPRSSQLEHQTATFARYWKPDCFARRRFTALKQHLWRVDQIYPSPKQEETLQRNTACSDQSPKPTAGRLWKLNPDVTHTFKNFTP